MKNNDDPRTSITSPKILLGPSKIIHFVLHSKEVAGVAAGVVNNKCSCSYAGLRVLHYCSEMRVRQSDVFATSKGPSWPRHNIHQIQAGL